MIKKFKRPTLLVSDFDLALRYYGDVLGFEVWNVEDEYSTDPSAYGYGLFNIPIGSRKRQAMFSTATEERGFSVIEVPDSEIHVPQSPRQIALLFECDDIFGLRKSIESEGFKVMELKEDSANGFSYFEMGALDPFGYLLTFFEYKHG